MNNINKDFKFINNKKIELYIHRNCKEKKEIEKDYYELKTQLKDMIDINTKDEIEHTILLLILYLFFNIPIENINVKNFIKSLDLDSESFKTFNSEIQSAINQQIIPLGMTSMLRKNSKVLCFLLKYANVTKRN